MPSQPGYCCFLSDHIDLCVPIFFKSYQSRGLLALFSPQKLSRSGIYLIHSGARDAPRSSESPTCCSFVHGFEMIVRYYLHGIPNVSEKAFARFCARITRVSTTRYFEHWIREESITLQMDSRNLRSERKYMRSCEQTSLRSNAYKSSFAERTLTGTPSPTIHRNEAVGMCGDETPLIATVAAWKEA
eukprot:Plantae.Rhodophyta-Rhodochaete_pulchella.ctg11140.p1 GENE.Plantae.Rhodophyta-Rhodochaete_pulchella.ctg11140~~Plantae.Rhodophyta-Rhodochaete_pulchella.ctg11140.p1  ORF type:complete len:187 (-),score=10.61 Plantae.Rhodophyta-Rhodochaete_pulchella.ctg11140:357-917(-)